MKRLIPLLLLMFATSAGATDLAHENVAVVDGTAVVSSTNPLHVTGASGSGATGGANPSVIIPTGVGSIFYVDGTNGSDSNNCKSSTSACATINHAISLTTADHNDVVEIFPLAAQGTYAEAVTLNKAAVTLIGTNPARNNVLPVFISPASGVSITVTATPAYIYNLEPYNTDGTSNTVSVTAAGAYLDFKNNFVSGGASTTACLSIAASSGGANVNIESSKFSGCGSGGGIAMSTSAVSGQILNNTLATSANKDIITSNTADNLLIAGNYFYGRNKTNYIDEHTLTSGNVQVTNNWFNVNTPLTMGTSSGQVQLGTGAQMVGNWPSGDIGTFFVKSFNVTSSAILSASATTFATATGSTEIDNIIWETDATGVAGCTNVNLITNNTKGLLSPINAVAASSLGANKNVLGTAAAVTALTPFVLEDGKVLQDQATVAPCTGAGVLQFTIFGKRLTPYASIN